MGHVLLVIGAGVLAGVFVWLKMWPKLVAVLAFVVGVNIGGWTEQWLLAAVNFAADKVGWALSKVTGFPPTQVAAAIPAVIGAVLLIVVVRHMWPKKGSATLTTAAAAFALPMLWPAFVAGLETLSPGITGGGA